MRWYYIVSGIFFIIPIIDFAFAAPVLVQETRQGGEDVVYIPEDAMTMLGKRSEEFDKFVLTLFGVPGDHSAKPEEFDKFVRTLFGVPGDHSPKPEEFDKFVRTLFGIPKDHSAKPEEWSSSAPSGPADGWTDVKQPLPSIPKEPSPESSPDHASPGPSDSLNKLWLGDPEGHFPPSSSSRPSGPADGGTDVKQPPPSIPKEPSPESSPDHASPGPGDGLNKLWLELFGDPEGHFSPPSSSRPSGPADGWTDVKRPLPSIPEEPSPESSPDHASPRPGNGLNKLWLELFGDPEGHFPPSSSSRPSGPADGGTDVKQPLPSFPEEPSLESSPDHASPSPSDGLNKLWLELFGDPKGHFSPSSSSRPSGLADQGTDVKQHPPSIPEEPSPESSPDYAPPSPGSLTESGYQLMNGDTRPGPSGPASSTMSSADQESMGAHALPNPGLPTESDREIMNVSPSSSVSSTDPEDEDSPSGKRRKTEKGWWLMLT